MRGAWTKKVLKKRERISTCPNPQELMRVFSVGRSLYSSVDPIFLSSQRGLMDYLFCRNEAKKGRVSKPNRRCIQTLASCRECFSTEKNITQTAL